jgi:uncharacterized membrane protein YccC
MVPPFLVHRRPEQPWHGSWEDKNVSATSAALLGALIGAGIALVVGLLTVFVAWRNERSRQRAAKATADIETLRKYTAVAFNELFALNHAASWVTWFAQHAPRAVNQQMRADFDAETHGTFPKLNGAMAMVASVSLDVYQELLGLKGHVFRLWEQVAIALHQDIDPNDAMKALPDDAIQTLRCSLPTAERLDDMLPKDLERIMNMARSKPRR